MAAIWNFKMATSYHGNRDGYLALKDSPSSNYTCANFHAFCQKSERFSPLASTLISEIGRITEEVPRLRALYAMSKCYINEFL